MARVTLTDFAAFCAIPPKVASELRAKGVIPLDAENMYDMVRPYLAQLREQAAGRHSSGDYELTAERARLAFHQANLASLDEEVKKKNLIPAEVVRTKWVDVISAMRAKLLGIPTRLAGTCAGKDAIEIEVASRDLIYQALAELKGDGID